jgi:hypothetical protein
MTLQMIAAGDADNDGDDAEASHGQEAHSL